MKSFKYKRVASIESALQEKSATPGSRFLGGGTNLLDLWKMGVEQPAQLVDLNRLPLSEIQELSGRVRIGALARNSDVAEHPLIRERYPVLSEALLSGASPQLRNAATVGGNLMQRTRCYYFYDPEFPACNKRQPGSGCGAIEGYNRMHAILGQSDKCIAVHPSDMCVALVALDAVIRVQSPEGASEIPITEFHRLPDQNPELDTNLAPDDLIISVDLPATEFAHRSHYLKIRDRSSYAFALVSAAVALSLKQGRIESIRVALGGVAHKPWRAREAEDVLTGKNPSQELFRKAAEAALSSAHGYQYNSFKIEVAKRTIVRALNTVAGAI